MHRVDTQTHVTVSTAAGSGVAGSARGKRGKVEAH
jgi:hypothetical protein